MFDVIRKTEYFACLDNGHASPSDHSLKGIQDGWVMSALHDVKNKKIMEVGGGDSRILPKLVDNQLWNVDKFEGEGQGPTEIRQAKSVNVIRAFVGDFDARLPVVDIIFSVSVIEHIPFGGYAAAFADMARCLSKGGVMYHAIDLPLNDAPLANAHSRITGLIKAVEDAGLEWAEPPTVAADIVFQSDMASNSDMTMWSWTKICDKTKITAPLNQIVSLKLIAAKPT